MERETRFFDNARSRLVFVEHYASIKFWEKHWESEAFAKHIQSKNRFVNRWTRRYLQRGSRVLEAGCGRGQNVWSLSQEGFDVYGVDYAAETVKLINRVAPNLKILPADVRYLPFPDGFFDGYWSLGVIEHYYDGFFEIIEEAARVIRPGGYLFLTFPHMCLLRQIKAKAGRYKKLPTEFDRNNFYQYALNAEDVLNVAVQCGFALVSYRAHDSVKGLKDECSWLKPALQPLYDSNTLMARILRKSIDLVLCRWTGHLLFLVLKKVF